MAVVPLARPFLRQLRNFAALQTRLLMQTRASALILPAVFALPAVVLGAQQDFSQAPAAQQPNPLRNVYYGDLHLHTAYSFDAYINYGTHVTPDQAYKFAKGQSVPYEGGQRRRSWPLDFLAVTDHSEYIGVIRELDNPDSAFSKSALGQKISRQGRDAFWDVLKLLNSSAPLPGYYAKPVSDAAWQREIEAANANYEPGKFTTFIAYEWSAMPDGKYNLHRNVFFRGDKAPLPFTARDSERPEDLWSYLESNRRDGIEALSISHNADASNGLMYDWKDSDGRPIDAVYAQRRALNEPLTEISQNKGQSETVSALSPDDPFANFENYTHLLISKQGSAVHGSYVREALGRGLAIQQQTGVNPYKFGVVGATDFHNGLTTSDENTFDGVASVDPAADAPVSERTRQILTRQIKSNRKPGEDEATDRLDNGSGNLTGVWAEENTRESIYDALRRKEVFATSGPRLRLRFFGGWDFAGRQLNRPDWIKTAYDRGVPMGGDLPARPAAAQAPRFAIWAVKDADGANLDRAQVVKVWVKGGRYEEKVFDAAWSGDRQADPDTGQVAPVGNTVDLRTATYQNTIGATELHTVWKDPEFDAALPAVYYLRVVEIPTPRWSTIQAVKAGLPIPDGKPAVIQERGWSSPIWYTPAPRP
jgi:hypothetical protein